MDILGPVDCPQYYDWETRSDDSYKSQEYFSKRPKAVRKAAIVVHRPSLRNRYQNPNQNQIESKVAMGERQGPSNAAMMRTRTAIQGFLGPPKTYVHPGECTPPTKVQLQRSSTPLGQQQENERAPQEKTPLVVTATPSVAQSPRPSAKVIVPLVQRMSSVLRCATPNLAETIQASKKICRAVRSITPQVYLQKAIWKK